MTAILKEFEDDEKNGVWQWFGVTSELLEKARKAVLDIPSTIFVRSGDYYTWPAQTNIALARCIRMTATCWRPRATSM